MVLARSRSIYTSVILSNSRAVVSPRPALSTRLSAFTVQLRAFCATPKRRSIHAGATLKVDQHRLMKSLHHTCQWGLGAPWGPGATETGMSRLSLSDSDKQVRDWFADTTQELGCILTVDEMGNQFAIRPGRTDGPPTYVGSHLDTQPTGGRYDGILGVHAGVEMLRVFNDYDMETEYPTGVINWTNEEGARFPKSMVASGVWAGDIPLEKAHGLQSVVRGDKATMRSELERIGYLGSLACSHEAMPIGAHFELHIEQGPRLENEKRKIGIVEGVQAYRWYTITVRGRDCHTGTTDLESRADALLAASRMIWQARVTAHQHGALASIGIINADPGSTNTVPGLVTFSLDLRANEDATVHAMEKDLKEEFSRMANAKHKGDRASLVPLGRPCAVEWRLDFDSPATNFHEDCIECVSDAASDVFGSQADRLTKRLVSGAGHDSVYTSKHAPTSMIFVPSRGGISHNPEEYTPPEDCALGAQVLMGAVLRYDKLRKDRAAEVEVAQSELKAGS